MTSSTKILYFQCGDWLEAASDSTIYRPFSTYCLFALEWLAFLCCEQVHQNLEFATEKMELVRSLIWLHFLIGLRISFCKRRLRSSLKMGVFPKQKYWPADKLIDRRGTGSGCWSLLLPNTFPKRYFQLLITFTRRNFMVDPFNGS